MTAERVLVTGFEPYGGRGSNPAGEVAMALHGRRVADAEIVGRTLPVSFARLQDEVAAMVTEVDPLVALGIGLWPGEPVIRIERLAINLADFEIADNQGTTLIDKPLHASGPAALAVTIPVRRIETQLLRAGIPARLSSTAGTFLCNACLHALLRAATTRPCPRRCGFIHAPYLPSQVAALLQANRQEARLELHQRADLASLDLATATRAVEIAVAVSVEAAHGR